MYVPNCISTGNLQYLCGIAVATGAPKKNAASHAVVTHAKHKTSAKVLRKTFCGALFYAITFSKMVFLC